MGEEYERLAFMTGLRVGQRATVEEWAIRLNCEATDAGISSALFGRSQGLLVMRPAPPPCAPCNTPPWIPGGWFGGGLCG